MGSRIRSRTPEQAWTAFNIAEEFASRLLHPYFPEPRAKICSLLPRRRSMLLIGRSTDGRSSADDALVPSRRSGRRQPLLSGVIGNSDRLRQYPFGVGGWRALSTSKLPPKRFAPKKGNFRVARQNEAARTADATRARRSRLSLAPVASAMRRE